MLVRQSLLHLPAGNGLQGPGHRSSNVYLARSGTGAMQHVTPYTLARAIAVSHRSVWTIVCGD